MVYSFLRNIVLFILLSVLVQPLSAQINLDNLYGLDSFSAGNYVQAPKNQVALKGTFFGQYLVLEVTIAKNWHLYSVTQPEGGTIRSTFQFESPELKLQKIQPLTAPDVDSNAVGFNVDIESHHDTVTWILTFQNELPKDQTIRGTLDGQVCQMGEGGVCIPVTVHFEAVYDSALDVKKYLHDSSSVADRFVFRADSQHSDSQTDRSQTTDSQTVKPTTNFIPQEIVPVTGFRTALLYAFLGGIILNFMPCVLPVIGLKILSFFEQAGKSRVKAVVLNLWYSLGLLSVFLFLAFLNCGLSILFTFDLFNILMACVVFAMALSLMGIWEISAPPPLGTLLGGERSGKLMRQEGVLGAFFKGIITTLLAIPCGAPLLSPAVNWADMQIRSGHTSLVFLAYGMIGLGMASPYLVIGAFPELLRFLPKPGQWMETFKKTMGFFLLIAVVWILFFVQTERMLPTVALLFALWFVCWLMGRRQFEGKRSIAEGIAALVIPATVILFSFQLSFIQFPYTLEAAMYSRLHGNQGEHWQPYTLSAFESARALNRPIVVDFTADWCVNCKVLEATVLKTDSVQKLLDKKQIVSLVADCTRQGEATELLKKLGSEQVPVLALFDPNNPSQPIVLRGYYTQKTLIELLEKW
ncbi:MAG: thioredoxin family protein [Planctomycetaceae bacterium]|jgi:thiol:disulfide interchange protein|nr:thioredoxin family protein [Planctomycetaceae bacterium]